MNHWIITKDLVIPADEMGHAKFTANVMFPMDTLKMQFDGSAPFFDTVRGICPIPFKMYDDDGNLNYEGLMSDHDFEPLDDFGMPNAGCTELRYFEKGEWKVL